MKLLRIKPVDDYCLKTRFIHVISSTDKKGEGEVLRNDATIFENIGNSPKSK